MRDPNGALKKETTLDALNMHFRLFLLRLNEYSPTPSIVQRDYIMLPTKN